MRQMYDLDLKRVDRIHTLTSFCSSWGEGGGDISYCSCTSASDVLVRLKRLITVLRQKCRDSTIIVASIIYRRRPSGLSSRSYDRKKKRVIKFLLRKFGAFEQGKKLNLLLPPIFHREILPRGWGSPQ